MREINYKKYTNFKIIDLNSLYDGSDVAIKNLDYNLVEIIKIEAPITLNILKERLREIFDVKKISQKALDIIEERISILGFVKTDNLYDYVLWPKSGEFKVDFVRSYSGRAIYDVPHQEMKNLVNAINLSGEPLYRKILEYFGFEVLTEKARCYLEYIEKKAK